MEEEYSSGKTAAFTLAITTMLVVKAKGKRTNDLRFPISSPIYLVDIHSYSCPLSSQYLYLAPWS
jgi:hypothetical protein